MTFLLTDVEGSTRLWQADTEAAKRSLVRHDTILSETIARHGGYRPVEQGEGDSVVAAFTRASDAAAAALDAQRHLSREPWPDGHRLQVRMAIHAGEADPTGGRYGGTAVIRTARLRTLAHGGQTLVSRAAAELIGDLLPAGAELVDLGTHRLRDLTRPEHVYQLSHPDLPGRFPPLRSVDRVANNLPAQLTSFVGRDADLVRISRLLDDVRLLTLTGPGGSGKTRLAAHAAAIVADNYPGGVWWVELGPLAPTSPAATAILSAAGLRDDTGCDAVEQLARHLAQPALLLLDNCEHVRDDTAATVEALLGRTDALTVLATSREPLGVTGETTWLVPPLTVPCSADHAADTLGAVDAVALFVDRARQARPNFTISADNAAAVAEICVRLDGLPLAIELAAARVRLLTPQQIVAGLDDRFRLLARPGAQSGRHQTLTASVQWSHDLLTDAERMLLRRLSVFAGQFTLDAAEAVSQGDGLDRLEILDRLGALVDKSLVVVDDETVEARYRLLETIRDYAAARLDEAGETNACRDRHLGVAVALAARAETAFLCDDGLTAELEAEHDNLRAALEWALATGRTEAAVTIAVGLSDLWLARGRLREADRWFDRMLADRALADRPDWYRLVWARLMTALIDGRSDPLFADTPHLAEAATIAADTRYVARLLTIDGTLNTMSDPAAGHTAMQEAVAAADASGDLISRVFSRLMLLVNALHRDDHGLADATEADTAALVDETSRQLRSFYHGLAAWQALRAARFGDARGHADLALGLAGEAGDAVLAGALATLSAALVELSEGQLDAAGALVDTALRHPRSPTREDAMLIGVRGVILSARASPQAALGLLAEAVALAQRVGDGLQIAFCTAWQAGVSRLSGDLAGARLAAETLVAHARQQHNPTFEAVARRELALIACADGDLESGEAAAQEALRLAVEADSPIETVEALAALASVATAAKRAPEAARLITAAGSAADALGYAFPPWTATAITADLDRLRQVLEPDDFTAACQEGSQLSLAAAVDYARRGRGDRRRPSTGWGSLTPTERQVVELVAEGLRNSDIAQRMFVAPSTVKTHLAHIFAKLDVSTRAELAAVATRRG